MTMTGHMPPIVFRHIMRVNFGKQEILMEIDDLAPLDKLVSL